MCSRTGIMAGVLLACLSTMGRAQTSEEALRAGLAEARQLINAGSYEQGHDKVLALVDEYGSDEALLLQIHRVKQLLKAAAFWSSHDRPEAKDLIAGKLESYNARSGKIKVSYVRDPDKKIIEKDGDDDSYGLNISIRELLELLGLGTSLEAGDFTFAFGVPMHPIVFDGPYTVEVSGRIGDRRDYGGLVWSNPMLLINAGDEGVYQVFFGYPRTEWGWGKPASIVHILGGKQEVLDTDENTPLEIGQDYTIKVNVSTRTITASANGRTFLKAKKKGKSFGQFGFRGCPKISGMVLNGQANTAWIEGLADRWVQQSWEEFDETYDALDELSTELADRVGRPKKRPRGLMPEYPGPRYPGNAGYLKTFEEFAAEGSYKKILTYMDGLSSKKVSDGFRGFMTAIVKAHLGQRGECLEACDQIIKAYPDFAPARLMRLNTLAALDRSDEALAELRELIAEGEAQATVAGDVSDADGASTATAAGGADHGKAPGEGPEHAAVDERLRVALATMLVQRGDYEAAQSAMHDALAAGVLPAELEGVAFMLTRARFGPEWPDPYDFASTHYDVRSDLNQRVCSDATKNLEQALSMYERIFGRGDENSESKDRYLVYIFSGSSGYMNYAGDLFGSAPVNTAGVYTPVLKQLLIWNLPDHEMLMRTIRHEGFHQYLDRRISKPPTWFNEGTAEYFETASLSRGKMTPGTPLRSHLTTLTAKGVRWDKLKDLVLMSRADFYGDATLHYAESWALVHYLLHSGRDEKRMYERYREALFEGADRAGAAEVAFADVDWNAMERAVKAHVKELAG